MTARPTQDRKYVRVYYDLIREFPDVYAEDAMLATWLRLLMVADAMWPGIPELPRSVKSRPLAKLCDHGLVSVLTGHRFRIRGLDAERTRRRDAARNAARNRWGNADGNADASESASDDRMPIRDERDETLDSKGSQGLRPLDGGRSTGRVNPVGNVR